MYTWPLGSKPLIKRCTVVRRHQHNLRVYHEFDAKQGRHRVRVSDHAFEIDFRR